MSNWQIGTIGFILCTLAWGTLAVLVRKEIGGRRFWSRIEYVWLSAAAIGITAQITALNTWIGRAGLPQIMAEKDMHRLFAIDCLDEARRYLDQVPRIDDGEGDLQLRDVDYRGYWLAQDFDQLLGIRTSAGFVWDRSDRVMRDAIERARGVDVEGAIGSIMVFNQVTSIPKNDWDNQSYTRQIAWESTDFENWQPGTYIESLYTALGIQCYYVVPTLKRVQELDHRYREMMDIDGASEAGIRIRYFGIWFLAFALGIRLGRVSANVAGLSSR